MSPVLKIKKDNERKEMDFELKYQSSLSVKQRFKMMFRKNKELLDMLVKHGYGKTLQIIKRK